MRLSINCYLFFLRFIQWSFHSSAPSKMRSKTITIPSRIVFQNSKKALQMPLQWRLKETSPRIVSRISPLLLHFLSSSVGVDLHSVIANNQQVFPHIGVFLFNKTVGVFSCAHDKVLSFSFFLSAIAWILCQRISIMESTMGYFANHVLQPCNTFKGAYGHFQI